MFWLQIPNLAIKKLKNWLILLTYWIKSYKETALKMIFSETFVTFHGCGYCYVDGTDLLQGTMRCFFPIHNPFWKEPCDTSNRIAKSTRNQLKKKSIATGSYCK